MESAKVMPETKNTNYDEFFEHSGNVLMQLSHSAEIIFINAEAERILGIPVLKIKDKGLQSITDSLSFQKIQLIIQSLLRLREPEVIDILFNDVSNRKLLFECQLWLGKNDTVHLLGIEKTDKRAWEQQLELSHAYRDAMLEANIMAVVLIDNQFKVTAFNRRASELLRLFFRTDLRKGSDVRTLVDSGFSKLLESSLDRALQGEIVREDRNLTFGKDQSYWVESSFTPIFTRGRTVSGILISVLDITERKEIEHALRVSKEKYQAITELSSDFSFSAKLDKEGNIEIEWITEAFARLTGFSEEDIAGIKNFNSLIFPQDVLVAKHQRLNLLSGHISESEFRIVTKTGDVRWLRRIAKPIYDPTTHKVERFFACAQDITEQKQMEEAMRKSLENYQRLLDALNEGVMYINDKGQVVEANRNAGKLLGFEDEEDLKGVHLESQMWKFIDENHIHISLKENPMKITLDTGVPQKNVVLGAYRADGSLIWLSINTNPLLSLGSRSIYGVVVSFSDITLIREAEEQKQRLENSLFRLSLVARQTANPILLTDNKRKINWINDAFYRLTEYRFDEAVGKELSELLEIDEAGRNEYSKLINSLEDYDSTNVELQFRSKNGYYHIIKLFADPAFDENQTPTGFIFSMIDITKEVEDERLLESARKKLEQLNMLKNSFLQNVSKDLKVPLNAVLGLSNKLSLANIHDEEREIAHKIYRNGLRMNETLALIIDFNKLESGERRVVTESFKPALLIDDQFALIEMVVKRRGLELEFYKGEGLSEETEIITDPSIVKHVLRHLLSNAIKFTESGKISVTCSIRESGSGPRLKLQVSDTGVGISEDNLKNIFDPFARFGENDQQTEGLGLGLPITKRLLDLIDGSYINLESKPGEGTTAYIEIPCEYVEQKVKDEMSTKVNKIKGEFRFLLIDDDETALTVASHYLRAYGIVDKASCSVKARELWLLKSYDFIFMDIDLGEKISGFDLVKEVRSNEKFLHTPVIALTSFVLSGDKEKLKETGFSHYLSKPFTKDQISKLLVELTGIH